MRTTGCNAWGQLGQGDRVQRTRFTPTAPIPGAVAVQAGEEHTAAVTASAVSARFMIVAMILKVMHV